MTGLSPLLAPGLLQRALQGVGVDAQTATAEDYLRALPQIRRRLAIYLPAAEVERRCTSIAHLLRRS